MKIYFVLDAKGYIASWGTSSGLGENEIEMDIEETHPFLHDNPFNYKFEDGELIKDESIILKVIKEDKMDELTKQCQEDILGYFNAKIGEVEYRFSFDYEAQQNFNGTLSFFDRGLIPNVQWTAYKDGEAIRITLTEEEFMNVVMTAFAFKNSKISRLRNELQPLVEKAETIEEVESIKW